jgi:NADH-quinone oxidoreductase subunit H
MSIGLVDWIEVAVKVSLIGGAVQGAAAYLVLAERRTCAFIQDRVGPNRCGPWGLLQPIADAVKLIFKEDVTPRHVNRVFYTLAPVLSVMPALATLAVVPFGGEIVVGEGRAIQLQAADVNIGLLYVFALASLGVYGLALGGWASNNKYSLLGGIRSSAQLISYELSLTLSVLTVILVAGTLRLNEIVLHQGPWPWQWHFFGWGGGVADLPLAWRLGAVVPLMLSGIVFIISTYAETNRLPFDLPEAESEIVSGYHTEYSSMKFGLYFLAEYANMLTGCALVATLFFGGWMYPGWDSAFMAAHPVLNGLVMVATFGAKTLFFMFVMIWVRWTLPRFRFDQLMELGWKRFVPIALACVVAAAAWSVLGDSLSATAVAQVAR